MEALADPPRPRPQLGGKSRQQLKLRRGEDGAQAQLRGGTWHARKEDRARFVGGEAGQPGPIAIDELIATGWPAVAVQRHASLCQRVDVAVNGAQRDLQLRGQLARRHPAACLEEQQDREQPARPHVPILPGIPAS